MNKTDIFKGIPNDLKMSSSFTVEIQVYLSKNEILFLKNIDWKEKYTIQELSDIVEQPEFMSLDGKEVIFSDDDGEIYLTSIGEQILLQILSKGDDDYIFTAW